MSDKSVLTLRPDTTDSIVVSQIFVEQLYKPVIGLKPYALIIDGGANGGFSTVWFQHYFPNAKIVAIEPDPENYKILRQNVEPIGSDLIQTEQCAIWWEWTHGEIRDVGLGAFGLQVHEGGASNVGMVPLAAWLTARPCLVKLDIEGSEIELFKHPAWMSEVDTIAVELHGQAAVTALDEALHRQSRHYKRWVIGETTFVDFED